MPGSGCWRKNPADETKPTDGSQDEIRAGRRQRSVPSPHRIASPQPSSTAAFNPLTFRTIRYTLASIPSEFKFWAFQYFVPVLDFQTCSILGLADFDIVYMGRGTWSPFVSSV